MKFITILHGGVSLGTPNLYYVIYGRPLKSILLGFVKTLSVWIVQVLNVPELLTVNIL